MTISRFIDIREDVKRVICNALDRMSAKSFIEENHRNPSKYRIEEHDMLNWVKANRKVMNAGKLKEDRVEAFEKLLEMMGECKRVNQYQ